MTYSFFYGATFYSWLFFYATEYRPFSSSTILSIFGLLAVICLLCLQIFSEISQITSNHSNLSNQVHVEGQQMKNRNLMKKLNREPI